MAFSKNKDPDQQANEDKTHCNVMSVIPRDPYHPRPHGYKTFFMLKSTEHESFLAHKC